MAEEMDTNTKKEVITSSYAKLVETLPVIEILNSLRAKNILTSTALQKIRALPTPQSKTMYLLDNFILRSLKVGIDDHFNSLVEALEESENLSAQMLGKQLKEGQVEITGIKPPAVDYNTKTAEEAIRSMFMVLIDGMQVETLMPTLITKRVITAPQQEYMKAQKTSTQKTIYLLNDIVIPSLRANSSQKFENLLQAMEDSEDLTCQSLATELNSRLGRTEISLTKIIPPSDDSGIERYLTGSLPQGISAYTAMEQWIYAICLIRYDTIVEGKPAEVTATGFVGSLTLKGKNGGDAMLVLVTNNHVFETLEQAQSASYQFGYQTDNNEKWQPELIIGKNLIFDNKDFFFTHRAQKKDPFLKQLDYTVIRVHEKPLKETKFISKLDGIKHPIYDCIFNLDKHVKPSAKVTNNQVVSVYHHPNSKVLQKSTQRSIECGYLLFYLCDTEEGSSGAPLVKTTNNGHRSVIALHRGWQKLDGNIYNCGTMMSTIIDHIQGEQPSYFGSEDEVVQKITNAGILV